VPVEEQVLPSKDLAPLYDKVVWLWVYRDFKGGAADRDAERVHNRMGVSSWPHLLFADADGGVLAESGRTAAAILEAAEKAGRAGLTPGRGPWEALRTARDLLRAGKKDDARKHLREHAGDSLEARDLLWQLDGVPPITAKDLGDPDADRRADALDHFLEALPKTPFVEGAGKLLEDRDADVRMRAVRYVAKAKPALLRESAAALLGDPMDAVKFAALAALKEAKYDGFGADLLAAWRKLDSGAIPSRNPNVVRLQLASAIGDAATEEAVPLLGAFAAKQEFLNGTTHACVTALGKIGARRGAKHVTAALLGAFPRAVTAEDVEKKLDAHVVRLARTVHEALREATAAKIAFGGKWGSEERAALLSAWERAAK
jgi:hypothetical protein